MFSSDILIEASWSAGKSLVVFPCCMYVEFILSQFVLSGVLCAALPQSSFLTDVGGLYPFSAQYQYVIL